jgi:cytochrome b
MHWSFVLLIPALWWTWKSNQMALHERLGYVALALLVFRLFWGLVGSSTARFASFVRGPGAVARYLGKLFSRSEEPAIGHNPLGGWSVLALLGLMIAEVVIGLFTQDTDGIESGPLTRYVSYDFADAARHWHGLIFNVLLGFIALHLFAIAFYLVVKRENLIGPMLTGRRAMAASVTAPRFAPWWLALVGLALGLGAAWWVSLGCPLPK